MEKLERKKQKVEWMLEDIIEKAGSGSDIDDLQEALDIIQNSYVYERL